MWCSRPAEVSRGPEYVWRGACQSCSTDCVDQLRDLQLNRHVSPALSTIACPSRGAESRFTVTASAQLFFTGTESKMRQFSGGGADGPDAAEAIAARILR